MRKKEEEKTLKYKQRIQRVESLASDSATPGSACFHPAQASTLPRPPPCPRVGRTDFGRCWVAAGRQLALVTDPVQSVHMEPEHSPMKQPKLISGWMASVNAVAQGGIKNKTGIQASV